MTGSLEQTVALVTGAGGGIGSAICVALAEAGASPAQVTRTRIFITDAADSEAVGLAHGEVFGEARPAMTMVVVKGMVDPRWKVEIEAEALIE